MIPVTQTKRGGPNVLPAERGDCVDACIASVLELPIERCRISHEGDWWANARTMLRDHGYSMVFINLLPDQLVDWIGDDTLWLASVPSLNLGTYDDGEPVMHVVVMRGDQLAHDPSLGDRYDVGSRPQIEDALLLVPIDPAVRYA